MPRFFIDTSDQALFVRHEEGRELSDVEAAKAVAVSVLPDMAREVLPDGDARTFLAIVRDESGGMVLQAALNLHVVSLVPDQASDQQE